MNNKKYMLLLVSTIVIVVISATVVTFAYLSFNTHQTGTNTVSTGCYNIDFTDGNSINLTSYPMSSESAFKLTPYTFTLKNTCDTPSTYQVRLNIKNADSHLLPYINYSLDKTQTNKLTEATANGSNSYILEIGSLPKINDTKTYNLYLWIDESAGNDIMGAKFQAEIEIYHEAG